LKVNERILRELSFKVKINEVQFNEKKSAIELS
jgi:hypothetical protein